MFVLTFRELNLIKDHQYSLHKLLLDFHPELQDLDSRFMMNVKLCSSLMVWMQAEFTDVSDSQKVSDVTEISSVGLLMSNLMKGDLLPSALIWITHQTSSSNQIPSNYIHRVTEIQGFNDPQKEEYFGRESVMSIKPAESSHTSEEQEASTSCATYPSSAGSQPLCFKTS